MDSNSDILTNSESILDIGGATGGLGNALKNKFGLQDTSYSVIDVDQQTIEIGQATHPGFKFFHGEFPNALPQNFTADLVLMQGLFPQIPDWKSMLRSMATVAKKYMTFSFRYTSGMFVP